MMTTTLSVEDHSFDYRMYIILQRIYTERVKITFNVVN